MKMYTVPAGVRDLATTCGRSLRAISAWMLSPDAGRDRQGGQGLAEYALILAFIAIVAIAALAFFGVQLSSVLTDPVGDQINNVVDIITP
jgi:Flp pilus assembly pilin Flp